MNHSTPPNSPSVLIISMGVSGSGKSTLAHYLAKDIGFTFLEADDFHSAANRAHMAAGKPLTDAMREPWIADMCRVLKAKLDAGENCVLAYSGLRKAHRQRFRELGHPLMYIHLVGSKQVIRERMEARTNHYMPPGLLDSQFAALEPTEQEADIAHISVERPIPDIVEQATQLVQAFIKRVQAQ